MGVDLTLPSVVEPAVPPRVARTRRTPRLLRWTLPLRRTVYRLSAWLVMLRLAQLRRCSTEQLEARAAGLRGASARSLTHGGGVRRVMATILAVLDRQQGYAADMNVVIAALHLLDGEIVEMAAAADRRRAVSLAALASAVRGVSVHVVTSSAPLGIAYFEALSESARHLRLTVGLVRKGDSFRRRRAAHRNGIVVGHAREFAMDRLRDHVTWGDAPNDRRRMIDRLAGRRSLASKLVMGPLLFAIVDEADRLLADLARFPIVLGQGEAGAPNADEHLQRALEAVKFLDVDDVKRGAPGDPVPLSDSGRRKIQEYRHKISDVSPDETLRNELIAIALSVRFAMREGEHYIRDGNDVVITDTSPAAWCSTERQRSLLRRGLELYRGASADDSHAAMVGTCYQAFFRRYRLVSGVAGSTALIDRELYRVYGVEMFRSKVRRSSGGAALVSMFDSQRELETSLENIVDAGRRDDRLACVIARDQSQVDRIAGIAAPDTKLYRSVGAIRRALASDDRTHAERDMLVLSLTQLHQLVSLEEEAPLGTGLDVYSLGLPETARDDWRLARILVLGNGRGRLHYLLTREDAKRVGYSIGVLGALARRSIGARLFIIRFFFMATVRGCRTRHEKKQSHTRFRQMKADVEIDSMLAFSGKGV